MKIAIFSDLQGVELNHLKEFRNSCSLESVDLVLSLGDINRIYLDEIRNKLNPSTPWIGVLGNHDSYGDLELAGVDNAHGKTIEVNGYSIGGFEGSVSYKDGFAPMYSQSEARFELDWLDKCDILISHNSPKGIHDKNNFTHQGFEALLGYIDKHNPKYMFHGHQHVNKQTKVGNTLVTGIYGGVIIDLNTGIKNTILKVI